MRCNLSGPLAAALLLSVASVPCPASWLDDTTHNVGVEAILAPRGTIDSGVAVTPTAVVANFGTSAESLWAFMAVDAGTIIYLDSLWLPALAPAGRETVAFANWTPRGRDSMSVTAWTECEGDTFPLDDTARSRFLVRVTDVAVTQIVVPAPDTVLDSGDIIYMQCRVWNFGNRSINFDLRFRIYKLDSTVVFEAFRNINLIAGGATLVTSPDPWVALPGVYMAECAALMLGDLHPENNVVRDTFYVRGTITTDVDARAVLAPTGVIDTTMTIVPMCRVGNNGGDSVEFWAFITIRDSAGGVVYAESTELPLGPNRTSDIEFPSVKFSIPGNYTAACSVYMPGDQNSTNDVKKVSFRVVPSQAVEESPKPQAVGYKPEPTVVRGVLFLPGARGEKREARSGLLDVQGRRVLALHPGANDVSGFSPGVYFVVSEPSAVSRQPSAVTVRKVIIQR
jgi:hypothetical protein